jgi:DnaJ like chaperone protein
MSIWGKLVGGAAGFMLGGPIGAMVGVAAGHLVDRMRSSPSAGRDGTLQKRIAFTVAVIVLCAKMAKADGRVTRDEVHTFRKIFRIPEGEADDVGRIWDEARQETAGFEPYAKQIAGLFHNNPAVLEELLSGLFVIALADGTLHPAEEKYLRAVADIFGIDAHSVQRIRESLMGQGQGDPYEILGVAPDAEDDEIKAAHRTLLREHHPDKLIAQGMPQEFIDVATGKMAAINDAYDRIRKLRNLT